MLDFYYCLMVKLFCFFRKKMKRQEEKNYDLKYIFIDEEDANKTKRFCEKQAEKVGIIYQEKKVDKKRAIHILRKIRNTYNEACDFYDLKNYEKAPRKDFVKTFLDNFSLSAQ